MEQAYAVLSSAAEEGELTTDLHEDINTGMKPLVVCCLPVTLLQQTAMSIILLATSAKKSITKGDGEILSGQDRHT